MPDKWEYPWYAAWDLAFHTLPLAIVDPDFAKQQMHLMLHGHYLHPNGQIPAYEWNFEDVNPPVLSLAALRVFEIEREYTGVADYEFLERVFQKLLLNLLKLFVAASTKWEQKNLLFKNKEKTEFYFNFPV